MHFIGAIIIGLIVGLIARALKPGRDTMGWIMTTVLGVVGSLVATWLGRVAGLYGPDDAAGFIASVVGALVVLAVYTGVSRRRGITTSITDRDRWAA